MSMNLSTKSQDFFSLLRQCKLAATRNGVMVNTSQIYDHKNIIFVAAFRLEARDRFLLEDVAGFRDFWCKIGLRFQSNAKFLGIDYLTCLHAILRRLESQEDAHLKADINTVLRPLREDDYAIRGISSTDWSTLATIKVFPALCEFEGQPRFRQERMESLAGSNKQLSLGGIRSMVHIRVCWSQVSFTSLEPSS